MSLEVRDGDHAGRRIWHDVWLSEAAISLAKRDLGKLGVTNLEQLERPLPEGIIVAAKVALRRGDDGSEFNRVTRFEVVGIEPPAPEPFAPAATTADPADPLQTAEPGDDNERLDEGGFDWTTGEQIPTSTGRRRGGKSKS